MSDVICHSSSKLRVTGAEEAELEATGLHRLYAFLCKLATRPVLTSLHPRSAMVYYFNLEWKKYKAKYHADRDDSWTKAIISKVHCEPLHCVSSDWVVLNVVPGPVDQNGETGCGHQQASAYADIVIVGQPSATPLTKVNCAAHKASPITYKRPRQTPVATFQSRK